jgi:hypothetical protein
MRCAIERRRLRCAVRIPGPHRSAPTKPDASVATPERTYRGGRAPARTRTPPSAPIPRSSSRSHRAPPRPQPQLPPARSPLPEIRRISSAAGRLHEKTADAPPRRRKARCPRRSGASPQPTVRAAGPAAGRCHRVVKGPSHPDQPVTRENPARERCQRQTRRSAHPLLGCSEGAGGRASTPVTQPNHEVCTIRIRTWSMGRILCF